MTLPLGFSLSGLNQVSEKKKRFVSEDISFSVLKETCKQCHVSKKPYLIYYQLEKKSICPKCATTILSFQ